MSTQPKHFYTLEEYFEVVKSSEEKYEYWNGQVFLMSGGSEQHTLIADNILTSLKIQLRGRQCRAMSGDTAILVPSAPPFRYADGLVVCGQLHFENISGVAALTNPILIVEVLSPSSQNYDRGAKFTFYQSIASFSEYLLAEQSQPRIIHYVKESDNTWTPNEIIGIESNLVLSSIDCTLALSDVYQDVIFPT
ncbi:MAG: hypothetical protein FD167_3991 [bacterium]|nr:MAG: hypothetical protein FD167_3991 [bacterium]